MKMNKNPSLIGSILDLYRNTRDVLTNIVRLADLVVLTSNDSLYQGEVVGPSIAILHAYKVK